MYCVYWIHAERHTDVMKEGYVGIAANFQKECENIRKTRERAF